MEQIAWQTSISINLGRQLKQRNPNSLMASNSNKEIQTHWWLTTWSWYRLTYETKVAVICTFNLTINWRFEANKIWRYWIKNTLSTSLSAGNLEWTKLKCTVWTQLENTLSNSQSAGKLEWTKFNAHCLKKTLKHTFNLPVGWQVDDYSNNVLL